MATAWPPYFSARELSSPDGHPMEMDRAFMERLIRMRESLAFPFPVTSACRSPSYNAKVGGASNSYHLRGRAVDIVTTPERRADLVAAAWAFGFHGVGVYKSHIHLDDRPHELRRVW